MFASRRFPTVNGESISLRLLSRGEQQFGFDRLDLSKKQEQIIRHLLAQPNGIILLTGPTGCGKSTSLYCFLSSINSVQRRIITIEEPVEYQLAGRFADGRETGDRFHLRTRTASHSAAGPERRDGRRNSRRRNGGHCHSRCHDWPPRFQHAAHERRSRRHHAFARYGCRAVPARLGGEGVHRATARAHDLSGMRANRSNIQPDYLAEIGFPVQELGTNSGAAKVAIIAGRPVTRGARRSTRFAS